MIMTKEGGGLRVEPAMTGGNDSFTDYIVCVYIGLLLLQL